MHLSRLRVTCVALLLVGASAALAQAHDSQRALNALLRGDYASSSTRDCVESSGGFDPTTFRLLPLPAPPGASFRRTLNSDAGVTHYNGDGTGTLTTHTLVFDIAVGPGGAPVTSSDSTCDVTYTVHDDLTFDSALSCTFQSLSGGVVFTGTVDVPAIRHQIVDEGRLVLISSAQPPVIETLTIDNVASSPRQRICTRAGTSSRLPR